MDVVLSLARLTLTSPRAAARALLNSSFPRELHWTLFLIVMCLGGAVFAAAGLVAPHEDRPAISGLTAAALVGASVLFSVTVMLLGGRLFGSRAEPADAMLLVLWLELLFVGVQAVLVLVELVLPGIRTAAGLIYLVLTLWLASAFTAELHGLDGILQGLFATIAATLAILFLLALVRAILIALIG